MTCAICNVEIESGVICGQCECDRINQERRMALAAPTGSAAGCSKWDIWPLMMAVGFVCMAKSNGMAELILRAITIAALTYSISHRLCRRQNDHNQPRPTEI